MFAEEKVIAQGASYDVLSRTGAVRLEKATIAVLIVLFAPIWIPVIVLMAVWVLYKFVVVMRPIWEKIKEKAPMTWLTWHQVKRMTGARTADVLSTLVSLSGGEKGIFITRPRESLVIEKLERRLGADVPVTDRPRLPEEVVFFEFRLRRRGRQRPSWREVFQSFLPQTLQPARA